MDPPDGDLTSASTMIGTLRYAAPERLLGDAVTPRTDVWALGAVLYEMLTGSPAVANADLSGALDASRAAPPSLDGLPPSLAPVVARAMSSDPAERYADAAELREAMLAAVGAAGPGRRDDRAAGPAPARSRDRMRVLDPMEVPPAVADPVPVAGLDRVACWTGVEGSQARPARRGARRGAGPRRSGGRPRLQPADRGDRTDRSRPPLRCPVRAARDPRPRDRVAACRPSPATARGMARTTARARAKARAATRTEPATRHLPGSTGRDAPAGRIAQVG